MDSETRPDPTATDSPSTGRTLPVLRSLPRNIWVVALTSFFTDVSSEMLTTLLPLFLSNVLGARTSVIGLIEGIAETTASLLKLVSGWLSDRIGTRKWLAVAGYAVSMVAKPLLLLATSWAWVLGIRFADRAGKGIRTAPRDALVADSTSEAQRGLAFGVHRAGDTAGAFTGLCVAFAVVWLTERSALHLTRNVFQTLVWLSILPAVLAVLGLAIGARDVAIPRPQAPKERVPAATLGKRFRSFLVIMVIFTLGNSSDAFLVLRAQRTGMSLTGVLGMMISFNLVYALVSGPAGALSDRIGRRRLIIGGWAIYALVYLGFASINAGWQAWILMAIYGLYYALTEGVAKAFVADLVSAEQRGTAYGLFNAAIGLTALPASLIAGLLWQGVGSWPGFGPSAPFYFGAALAFVATVLMFCHLGVTSKELT